MSKADVAKTTDQKSSGTDFYAHIAESNSRRRPHPAHQPLLLLTRPHSYAAALDGNLSQAFQASTALPRPAEAQANLPSTASPHHRDADATVARPTETEALGGLPKRIIDLLIAIPAIVALSPLLLAVAAIIRLSIGSPIIFSHQRVGLGGREFPCYKFRTMVTNADEVLERHLAENPECAREWSERQKLANDPRVPKLGRFLRKTSIDELPQLFNVVLSHMSCIGPRPVTRDELERYGANVREYHQTRPGMTGLWQVSGRNSLSYEERVRLDTQYVRTWSMACDLWILLRTVRAVFQHDQTS